jgi:hypothetical protein
MATIGFAIAASYIIPAGWGTAATIAATGIFAGLGSIIDSRYVFPNLFPNESQRYDDGNMGDIGYFSFDEGAPALFPVGSRCNTDGQLIWMKGPSKTKPSTTTGGKGGGSRPDTTPVTRWYADLAVAFTIGRWNQDLLEVYADEKLVYQKVNTTTKSSDNISCDAPTGNGTQRHWSPVSNGVDLTAFQIGQNVDISNYSNAINNGTKFILAKGIALGGTYYFLDVYNPSGVSNAGGPPAITFYQELHDWTGQFASGVKVYKGGQSHGVDTVISAHEGASNTPAFNRTMYIRFDDLDLTEFGHRIPRFRAVYQADDPTSTIKEILPWFLEQAGLDSEDYDLARIPASVSKFYFMARRGAQIISRTLQPMCVAHKILAQEHGGKLHFFYKPNVHTIEVNVDDLSARKEGEAVSRRAWIEGKDMTELPSMVKISYIRYGTMEKASVISHTGDLAQHINAQEVNLPITHYQTYMQNLADDIRATAWAQRYIIQLRLPESYFYIVENDVIKFKDSSNNDWYMLVQKKDKGENGIILFEGVSTMDYQKTEASFEEEEYVLDWGYQPPTLQLKIFDHAPLKDDHHDVPGFYVAAACSTASDEWRGAILFVSLDGGTNYDQLVPIYSEANMGSAQSVLGGGVTGLSWDRTNTVTVRMPRGSLESATEDEVLKGANRMLLGDEIIGFANATLQTADDGYEDWYEYELDTLLRGLRDTIDEIDGHAINDAAVLLTDPGVQFVRSNIRQKNEERKYKAVPSHQDESDVSNVVTITHKMGSVTCFSPTNVQGVRSGYDVVCTWLRRTRLIATLFSEAETPIEEPKEIYEIDFYDSTDTFLRTKTVEDAVTVTYTQAEQTADGVSLGTTIKFKVFQMSMLSGRGKESEDVSVAYP